MPKEKDHALARGVVLRMALDIIGEKTEKYNKTEDKLCQDCPLIAEIVRELRLAMLQDDEETIEEMRLHYGVCSRRS